MLPYLASLKLTLWLLGLFLIAVSISYLLPAVSNGWLALPLFLLAVNLLAAIIDNPKFRQQLPLLSFHIALLLLLLLIATSQLTSLKGEAEVTTGERFSGELVSYRAGPLHQWNLQKVEFLLDKFSINYAPGLQREKTIAQVRWIDQDGKQQLKKVGDQYPLILNGYRFYTSHNKGFSPVFSWHSLQGETKSGSIHLPPYPAQEYRQALEWNIPGSTQKIWTQLQFDEVILNPDKRSQFHVPQYHRLAVRIDETRYLLQPGEGINLADGRLIYESLQTWMGFSVTSDWTLPWLFASGLAAVLSIGWHYGRKFSARPWRELEDD
ncbi:MAG: cytochrome c biogenesis protein ResB [Chromatiales bacterium]|nr:cytochrome c biogenesis protein ResB [Chromatiales bacterium]